MIFEFLEESKGRPCNYVLGEGYPEGRDRSVHHSRLLSRNPIRIEVSWGLNRQQNTKEMNQVLHSNGIALTVYWSTQACPICGFSLSHFRAATTEEMVETLLEKA